MSVSAFLVAGVAGPSAALEGVDTGPFDEAVAGFRALAEHTGPRIIVGLLGLEMVIYGALDLLFVVLALDLLSVGSGWVGYFNAIFAAGGVAGAAAAVTLVGRRYMAPAIVVGLLVWGATFMVIAGSSRLGVVVVILIVGGAARAFFDVAAKTLLQRISPADVLARVFGVLEATSMAGMAIGQLLRRRSRRSDQPEWGHGRRRRAAGGGDAPGAPSPRRGRPRCSRTDRRDLAAALDSAVPMLPPPAIEGIAHALEPRDAADGEIIIHEGDIGDRYYAIADGTVAISTTAHRSPRSGGPRDSARSPCCAMSPAQPP